MKQLLGNIAVCAMVALLVTHTGTTVRAGLVMTVDAPGVQTSTVAGVTTETFNSFNAGQYTNLTTAVGTLSTAGAASIVVADLYGGAGGTGKYFALGAESGSADAITLMLNGPASYFGMWWSAADAYNGVQLYSGTTLLASYNTAGAFAGLPSSYYGNPNSGADAGEMFAYVNFNATEGTAITSVVFTNGGTTATGFEADNFSVLNVPEPSTLVLLGTTAAAGWLAFWRRGRQAATAVAQVVPVQK